MTEEKIDSLGARPGRKANKGSRTLFNQPMPYRRDMKRAHILNTVCLPALLALIAWSLAVPASGQSGTNASLPTPRIVGDINDTDLVTLQANVHLPAQSELDLGAVSDDLPLQRMMLVLKPGDAQQAALKKFLADQQNPNSSSFHRWLTPAQFGARYGVAQQDAAKIAAWLQAKGFSVEPFAKGQNVIIFSGAHAQFKNAFHAEIHSYTINGQQRYRNATAPQIPSALAPVVEGVASLSNIKHKPLHTAAGAFTRNQSGAGWKRVANSAVKSTTPKSLLTTTDSQGDTWAILGPYDFATLYNIKPLWDAGLDGTGQTIAIVSDSAINPLDIDQFRSVFGLPAKKLNIIYDGLNPGIGNDETEADLDVEWAGGVAKGATIDLVVAANTNTTAGIDLAAQYIIDNNLAPLMNVSYGECELGMGNAENALYEALYQQAAAQGITVMVSAGDSNSAQCDIYTPGVLGSVGNLGAGYGLAVNGLASTSYNVAVGGTDLSGNFYGAANYWSTSNDPTTLQSLISYVPETPWNNTCGNAYLLDILPALKADGTVSTADSTSADICNDSVAITPDVAFLENVGGGGGSSNCTVYDGTTYPAGCTGRAKPVWQSRVLGVPNDSARDLPDVSLMAGNGLWGSMYAFCQSDEYGPCDPAATIEGAGGTSFASPSFAGIMAIVNQKTQSQQGNANYILYKMGASEYSDPNALAACNSSAVTAGNACVFYDTTQGSNAPPCLADSVGCAANPAGTVATSPYGTFGVLPGWFSGPGYDMASGLGSVNAYNLVNNWSTAASSLAPSQVSLSAPSTAVYGSPIAATISVSAAAGGSGTPSGDVAILPDSSSSAGIAASSPFTLVDGVADGTVGGLAAGLHQLYARYEGDTEFAGSTSIATPITITPASTSSSLIASRTSMVYGESVTFTNLVETTSTAASPTGSVIFTDTTTGTVLGTVPVTATTDPGTGASIAKAYLNVPGSALTSGANSIAASYSGDGNYVASNASALTISYAGPFTVTISPATLVVAPSNPAASPAAITVSPNGGYALTGPLTFACQSPVQGVSCSFSASTLSGTSVNSALTIQLSSPLLTTSQSASAAPARLPGWMPAGGLTMLGICFAGFKKRRRFGAFLTLFALATSLLYTGCGGSGSSATTTGAVVTTTTLTSSSASPAWASAVTLQAKVAASKGAGSPTGTITFMDGSTVLATVPLANGSASYTTSSLPLGEQSITAQYSGDSNNFTSTSAAASVDVNLSTTLAVVISDHSGNTTTAQLPLSIQ